MSQEIIFVDKITQNQAKEILLLSIPDYWEASNPMIFKETNMTNGVHDLGIELHIFIENTTGDSHNNNVFALNISNLGPIWYENYRFERIYPINNSKIIDYLRKNSLMIK